MTGRVWKKGTPDPLLDPSFSGDQMNAFILESIEFYNNNPHSSLVGLSPNESEESFFREHGNEHPEIVNILSSSSDSSAVKLYETYQKDLIDKYQGDWRRFFLDWFEKQTHWQEKTTSLLESQLAESRQQYQTLYSKHLEQQKQIEFLYEEARVLKEARELAEERKLKRQNAKKVDLRQTVSSEDFNLILTLVKGCIFTASRRRLALSLLFVTGLRVSNLLTFTVENVRCLFESGETTISLIKGGESRFPLHLSNSGLEFFRRFKADWDVLYAKRSNDSLFFVSKDFTPISREFFDRELNNILTKASVILEKHLRTHSFRATMIPELLKSTPIDEVKEVMGHKSIATTLEYKRGRLSSNAIKKILNTREFSLRKIKKIKN